MISRRLVFIGFLFLVVGFGLHCSRCSSISSGVKLDVEKTAFLRLSDYQFFIGTLSDLLPNEGVLPYDLITPLFTDYAFKSRFVWMPENASAQYNESDVFEFPVGAVLIKNFYYPIDFNDASGKRQIMETRLLVKRQNGWDALPYIWNENQSDAYLDVAGDNKPVRWRHYDGVEMSINYSIPNKNQCKSCHLRNNELMPIGPKARNLNKKYTYESGRINQLSKWKQMGYLDSLPDTSGIGKLADWQDDVRYSLSDRAISYLEVNCGHCHRPEGPANTSGLHLTTLEKNPSNLGICKAPVAAGKGTGGRSYDIVPGKPVESILIYRMKSMDPGVMMPELGRQLPHQEGIELISDWIASLEGNCDG